MQDITTRPTRAAVIADQQFADFIATNLIVIDSKVNNPKTSADFFSEIEQAINQDNYTMAILLLTEHIDAAQGIYWHLCPTFNGLDVLLRDARNCKAPNASNSEPYIIIALNNLRATIDLLKIEEATIRPLELQRILKYLQDAAYSFFLQTINLNDKEAILKLVRNFNSVLVTNLASGLNITFTEASEILTVAKEFTNLKEPSKHIVTLLNLECEHGKKATVFQADLAQTELTPNLQNEYRDRKNKVWYKILPARQQKLVDYYIGPLTAGNRVLPTQARTILVGLRNRYRTVLGVIEDSKKRSLVLSSMFHSGTIVYLGKNAQENKRIGELHGQQLQTSTKSGIVFALTLNTGINPTGHDSEIIENSSLILQSIKGLYANLPLNAARRISKNDNTGTKSLLEIVIQMLLVNLHHQYEDLKNNDLRLDFFKRISGYLRTGDDENIEYYRQNLTQIRAELCENKTDKEISDISSKIEIIHLSLDICFLMYNNKKLIDPNNRNLMIGCYTNILVNKLSYYLELAINSSCESGKDRTGILMIRTAMILFMYHFFHSYELSSNNGSINACILNNIRTIAFARHLQFLAGFQTACGTFGIKSDSQGAMPTNEFSKEVIAALIQPYASYNKELLLIHSIERFHFPMGDVDLAIQQQTICHSLNLFAQELKLLIPGYTATTYVKSFFNGSHIVSESFRSIVGLQKEIPKTNSLAELQNCILQTQISLKNAVFGTVYSAGDAFLLLKFISENLKVVIEYERTVKNAELLAPQ